MNNPLGLLCPALFAILFVWAGSNIASRKGFEFTPWVFPCLTFGIVAMVALYALPSAAAPNIPHELAHVRGRRADRFGTFLSLLALFLLVAIVAMVNW